jgi:hypothetical protein
MPRPKGVNFMAGFFVLIAFSVFLHLPELVLSWRLLVLSVANLLISVILAVALLKMKTWSRWVSIAVYVISLVFIPREVIAAHGVPDLVRVGLRTLFFVWTIWYLSQPHVKAAFRSV